MPEWELVNFVERLYARYHRRLTDLLDGQFEDWFLPDDNEGSGPGAHRPGGLVAREATKSLEGTGIYVYAAHPSQADQAEEDDEYSGPRWYVSCMEAAIKRYSHRGMAPPPPAQLQELLWPDAHDRCQPWLTEVGWTIVPEHSDPQILHADICSSSGENARKPQLGRYHHFAWKLDRSENCTTHVVPGAFTEGAVEEEHYEQFRAVKAPAIIFDSEMLHRGGPTRRGIGWTSTLTIQVSSGGGWPHLSERVSAALMWYTQPLGWVVGDAVDALVSGSWRPGLIESRDESGRYNVTLAGGPRLARGLRDQDLRYRQARSERLAGAAASFALGEHVEARFDGEWHTAKVSRRNADGTYRVKWAQEHSCTDGLEAADLRKRDDTSEESSERPRKRRRALSQDGGRGADADWQAAPQSGKDAANGSAPQTGKGLADLSTWQTGAGAADGSALRASLFLHGWIEFPAGLPETWRTWALFGFVEHYYDLFGDLVTRELDALRDVWTPCECSEQRYGAFAAVKVSERLEPYGLAVYSPGQSHSEVAPYQSTGPRWYVSVTAAAIDHFGIAPPPPAELHSALFGHPADSSADGLRARGLGWTLAPPKSDPQAVHADIWGMRKHARTDRTRWPHILWKRSRGECCTTQIVPGAFTEGEVTERSFAAIMQVRTPAVVLDSEMLHRGAATPLAPSGSCAPVGWTSTLSLELCSPSGWAAWEDYDTGGTVKDPTSNLDWRMLRIHQPSVVECKSAQDTGVLPGGEGLPASTPTLPPAPWRSASGLARLRKEQERWELFSE